MKLGVDLSILDELNQLHPSFKYQGQEVEPFSFFANHSHIDMVRLRLWHNPYDEEGNPYGGGTNDLACFLRLAEKAKENGMQVLLDFHYSDFWVDPSRQKLPKAWVNKTYQEVVDLVGEYTREVLIEAKKRDIPIGAVQIGNEITHGMLFPFGELSREFHEKEGGGFEGLATLLQAGCQAVKEIYPEAKRIIHVEHAASKDLQEWFFGNLLKYPVDFEVIGESYYPYWHGPFRDFKDNISNLTAKYGKEIWVMEMGYEYAESRVEGHHSEFNEKDDPDFAVGNINGKVPFPLTKEGQAGYLKTLLGICKELGIGRVFYWEPAWVLLPNQGWALDAGQIYCGLTPTPGQNDWANETLFDFDGNANPGIDVFTQDYVDSL